MRKELDMDEMVNVAGGNVYINGNNGKLCFDSFDDVYQLKNCTPDEAAALCKSLIGKFGSIEKYDQGCLEALEEKGWIEKIVQ